MAEARDNLEPGQSHVVLICKSKGLEKVVRDGKSCAHHVGLVLSWRVGHSVVVSGGGRSQPVAGKLHHESSLVKK